jgi:hypothetical protein
VLYRALLETQEIDYTDRLCLLSPSQAQPPAHIRATERSVLLLRELLLLLVSQPHNHHSPSTSVSLFMAVTSLGGACSTGIALTKPSVS